MNIQNVSFVHPVVQPVAQLVAKCKRTLMKPQNLVIGSASAVASASAIRIAFIIH